MRDELRGILPAVASPCDESDNFLDDKFAELVTHLYTQGVHGLYVCGATGDGYRMRLGERRRATEISVELSKPFGGTTIVHVGADSTRDAVELAEHAAACEASAVSSMPIVNCTQAQLVSYYKDIAHAAGIPVVVYYVPALTNHTLSVPEMLELLDIDGVVGFKFSDYNLFFLKRVMQARPDTLAYNGLDEILTAGLLFGACGGIGMYYNIFPRLFLQIYGSVQTGDITRAMDLQSRLAAFLDVAFNYGIRTTMEFVLKSQGFGPYYTRRPRPELDDDSRRQIESDLEPKIAAIEEACCCLA